MFAQTLELFQSVWLKMMHGVFFALYRRPWFLSCFERRVSIDMVRIFRHILFMLKSLDICFS